MYSYRLQAATCAASGFATGAHRHGAQEAGELAKAKAAANHEWAAALERTRQLAKENDEAAKANEKLRARLAAVKSVDGRDGAEVPRHA